MIKIDSLQNLYSINFNEKKDKHGGKLNKNILQTVKIKLKFVFNESQNNFF